MRVFFIARNSPPVIGGAEKLNYELSQRLKEQINLKLIANKRGKYSPIFYIGSFFKVLFGKRVDVIFLSDALLSPLIPAFKIFKRKPIVVKVHGLDITFSNKLYQFFIPKFVNMANRIICISRATKEECVKRGVNQDKCTVIPIGINPGKIHQDRTKENLKREVAEKLKINFDNKKIILSVGALVERKGVYWFIKNVIYRMLKIRKNFIYLIVGGEIYRGKIKNITYKGKIEDIIEKESLKNYIIILGKISNNMLDLLYNISDIFVMPNIPVEGDMEGFGIVAIEAASYGLPVVASGLEGIKDAVQNNKNGFLINPGDSSEFIKVIDKLLKKGEKRKEFGEKARRFTLEIYDWDKIIQKYIGEFRPLVSKHKF